MKYSVSVPTMVPAETYDLGQKVWAAIWAGVFTTILFTVLLYSVLVVATIVNVPPPWQLWPSAAGVAIGTGIVVSCRLGYRWVVLAATRSWEVDDRERSRRYEFEDAEMARQQAAAENAEWGIRTGALDEDNNPATLTDIQRLHMVALMMLRRNYVEGKPATREAMTQEGLCTQPEWNVVNQAMKAAGLKRGYSFTSPDLPTAWAAWVEGVRFEGGYIEVMTSKGQWKAVEIVGE